MEKNEKKVWNKGYKRAIRPFKIISIVVGVMLFFSLCWLALVFYCPNPFISLFNDPTGYLENEGSVQYYSSDFSSDEERCTYEDTLIEKIEEEGATLLKNENCLPLKKGSKLSLFSTSSVDLVYGGTGSGTINTNKVIDLKDGLCASSFEVNERLWQFYSDGEGKNYRRKNTDIAFKLPSELGECPYSVITDDVKATFKDFGDAAIVVLSRTGGEGADLENAQGNDYLSLDENERVLLQEITKLKRNGTFKNVVVLLNTSNPISLNFMQDSSIEVDALLWVGEVGERGTLSIGRLLCGDVTPSGSLVDTWLYDNGQNPVNVNFKTSTYTNYSDFGLNKHNRYYVTYQEGIYVGYRYFETRYEDGMLSQGNSGDYNYNSVVAYPFGYSLSYTDFSLSDMQTTYKKESDSFLVKVTVTNTGEVSGSRSVQVYGQSEYTSYDQATGIEKSSVNLVGFGKTKLLVPGESETLTMTVNRSDLATYDCYGKETYILEQGTYYLTVAFHAHAAVENILTAKGVSSLGDMSLCTSFYQMQDDFTTYSISQNGTKISNLFSQADWNLNAHTATKITYLSRRDWQGTYPKESVSLSLNEWLANDLAFRKYTPVNSDESSKPKTSSNATSLTAYQMMGVPFDDEKWQDYISQMSVDELVSFCGDAYHFTKAVASINLQQTKMENGPQGYNGFYSLGNYDSMQITSCDILAATFDKDLATEVGRCIGNDCLCDGVCAIFATGNNLHRSPYGGRNFEYYSEDPYLSGAISKCECEQIQQKGVHVILKHFVCNDSEENRQGLGIWVNEQTLRELYLKPFQTVCEALPTAGVMVSYTRLGTDCCDASTPLLQGVLRGEWGSLGIARTDSCYEDEFMCGSDALLSGVNLIASLLPYAKDSLAVAKNDANVIRAMQDAAHITIYNIVNSSAMNGITANTVVHTRMPTFQVIAILLFVLLCALFIVFLTLRIVKGRKYKKLHPRLWKQKSVK